MSTNLGNSLNGTNSFSATNVTTAVTTTATTGLRALYTGFSTFASWILFIFLVFLAGLCIYYTWTLLFPKNNMNYDADNSMRFTKGTKETNNSLSDMKSSSNTNENKQKNSDGMTNAADEESSLNRDYREENSEDHEYQQEKSDFEETTLVKEDDMKSPQEVYNISSNIFSYEEADSVCRAFDSKLATYEQIRDAHEKGADWCNYGWSEGKMALYPTQQKTWEKLQEGPEELHGACGIPGVNGGHFDNGDLRFGVNCYGIKPEQRDVDRVFGSPDFLLEKILEENQKEEIEEENPFESQKNDIALLPFNKKTWSLSRETNVDRSNFVDKELLIPDFTIASEENDFS